MMAALFLILSIAIAAIYFGKRSFGIVTLLIGLVLIGLMLWHHATDTLRINW